MLPSFFKVRSHNEAAARNRLSHRGEESLQDDLRIIRNGTFFITLLVGCHIALGKNATYPTAKVSFSDFKNLVVSVEKVRAKRVVSLDRFLELSKQSGTIILDSRSDFRFDRVHLKGAKHLAFTDFTQDNLQKVIPSFDTTVLIYCNNNFKGDEVDFASKIGRTKPSGVVGSQIEEQGKPIMLALNIPTFINLYGYGYRDVYELGELVDVKDPRIQFEGSIVNPSGK